MQKDQYQKSQKTNVVKAVCQFDFHIDLGLTFTWNQPIHLWSGIKTRNSKSKSWIRNKPILWGIIIVSIYFDCLKLPQMMAHVTSQRKPGFFLANYYVHFDRQNFCFTLRYSKEYRTLPQSSIWTSKVKQQTTFPQQKEQTNNFSDFHSSASHMEQTLFWELSTSELYI